MLAYLKNYERPPLRDRTPLLELRRYTWAGQHVQDFTVHVQYLSVYIQSNDGDLCPPDLHNKNELRGYHKMDCTQRHPKNLNLNLVGNGNTIIVSDHSVSGQIQRRCKTELESRWRRLPSCLLRSRDYEDDNLSAILNSTIYQGIDAHCDRVLTGLLFPYPVTCARFLYHT